MERQRHRHRRGPALELTYVSKDGEEGYPGTVTAKTVYTLTNDNELRVEMQATTDKTTLVSMAHHSYWNLGGNNSGTILEHELTLFADQSRRVADGAGRQDRPVEGHALRLHQRQSDRQGAEASRRKPVGFDHNWVVNGVPNALRPVAGSRIPSPAAS